MVVSFFHLFNILENLRAVLCIYISVSSLTSATDAGSRLSTAFLTLSRAVFSPAALRFRARLHIAVSSSATVPDLEITSRGFRIAITHPPRVSTARDLTHAARRMLCVKRINSGLMMAPMVRGSYMEEREIAQRRQQNWRSSRGNSSGDNCRLKREEEAV